MKWSRIGNPFSLTYLRNMATIQAGNLFQVTQTAPWLSPEILWTGIPGNIAYSARVRRGARPSTWQQAGWLKLLLVPSGFNQNYVLKQEVSIFEEWALILPESFLTGSRFRCLFTPVDYLGEYTLQFISNAIVP